MGRLTLSPELKQFNKLFEQFRYKIDSNVLFDDFLTMAINFFSCGRWEELRDNAMSKYEQKEKDILNNMFSELLRIYRTQFNENGLKWYDPLGTYYEYLAYNSKQKAFGQFFTPAHICDLMTQMTKCDGKSKSFNDPACGSGRMLLSLHTHYPGNYVFGEDIDPMCVKISAINLMMHGCIGEVVCHNSLSRGDFRFGFVINSILEKYQIPSILPITKEQSAICHIKGKKADKEPIHMIVNGNDSNTIEIAQMELF